MDSVCSSCLDTTASNVVAQVFLAGGIGRVPKIKAALVKLFEREGVVQDAVPADEVLNTKPCAPSS